MINWKVRLVNKNFWLALLSALLLLVQVVLALFGVTFDYGELGNKLAAVVNAVFGVLAVVGVVNDPTTYGLNDSERAMSYETPYQDIPPDED